MKFSELKEFLDTKVAQYNRPAFIPHDPICIPHRFQKKQDIEIAAFFAAILAWGQRKTIINKCTELLQRMDNEPYQFMLHHTDQDLKNLLGFKHRTFNDTDLLYFVSFFQQHYQQSDSLQTAFIAPGDEFDSDYLPKDRSFAATGPIAPYSSSSASPACLLPLVHHFPPKIERSLNHFRSYFFSLSDFPRRTMKHISSPFQKSTCKRLNMFLRWMVRRDDLGVDFGIWNQFNPKDLICPCDVHVDRVARQLGLINRKQTDWQTAVELTNELIKFDPVDPIKYDFALFGMGVEEKIGSKISF